MRDWAQFEKEITELVRAFGYDAVSTVEAGDFGADVVATNVRRRVIVQCKLYKSGKIGLEVLQKLLGSCVYYNASEAICVTTSGFTKQAYVFAERTGVKLVDRDLLVMLCRDRSVTIPSL